MRSLSRPGHISKTIQIALGVVCSLTLPLCLHAQAVEPAEQFVGLIEKARGLPASADELLAASGEVESALGSNPLRSPARSIRALAELHNGGQARARLILEELAADSREAAAYHAARHAARLLLTLMDREQMTDALQRYYAKNLRYPASIEALSASLPGSTLPLHDRWGDPWDYALTTPRFFQVKEGQTYRLSSKNTGDLQALSQALARAYGARLQPFEITQVVPTRAGGGPITTFRNRRTREEISLSANSWVDSLWFLGQEGDYLFISDGFHFDTVNASR